MKNNLFPFCGDGNRFLARKLQFKFMRRAPKNLTKFSFNLRWLNFFLQIIQVGAWQCINLVLGAVCGIALGEKSSLLQDARRACGDFSRNEG